MMKTEYEYTYLSKTTFDEIAEDLDELQQYEQLLFCSLDLATLEEYNLEPYEYYIIEKVHFTFQDVENCSVLIRHADGTCLEMKSMDILTDGDVGNDDLRQRGIREFLKEYYEKYMHKNETNSVYYWIWKNN